MDISLSTALQFLQQGGVVGILIIFFLVVSRGWYVPGEMYKDMKRDRDDWKEIALKGSDAAKSAVEIMEKRRFRADAD